ncbi:MAG: extracellular solute-binding protein [Anaerolineae bacterium]|nr:extracellular solute-binding protein [Anaerolineae bacterium]
MNRHLLARIFAVAFVVILVAAGTLQGNIATAQEEVITLVSWRLGTGTEEFERETFELFNASHPNIQIVYEPALAGLDWSTEGMQKLRTAWLNDAGPDFLGDINVGADLRSLVETGEVFDLTDAYAARGWDQMPQQWIDWATVDGRIYALPLEVHHSGVFYNKGIFAEVGVDVPTTYQEFLDVSQALKDAGYIPFTVGFGGGWPAEYQLTNWLYLAADDELVKAFNAEVLWTESEALLQGVTRYQEYLQQYSLPDLNGLTIVEANDMWFQGKAAMTFMHSAWNGPSQTPPEFEIGFFVVPPMLESPKWSGVGGIGGSFVIAADCPHPEAVYEFIDWYFAPEQATRTLVKANTVTPFAYEPPADIEPWLGELYSVVSAHLPTAGETNVDYLPPNVAVEFRTGIQGMVAGDLTPQQVLENIQTAHQAWLAEQ